MNRKYLLHMLAVLTFGLITLGFSSCGGGPDEDENNPVVVNPDEKEKENTTEEQKDPTAEDELRSKLVGTWEYQEATAADGTKVPKQTIDQIGGFIKQLTRTDISIDKLTFTDSSVNGTDYTVEGNKLILKGTENSSTLQIEVKDVNEENLTLDVTASLLVALKVTILYKKQQEG